MKATWLGHSAFLFEGSKTVVVDPWLTGNPSAARKAAEIKKADYIVVTHEHDDHVGDTFEIATRTGATVVALWEFAAKAEAKGCKSIGANLGGAVKGIDVGMTFTLAFHSAVSNPCGVVLEMDGKRVYHSGDTCLFGDMALIGELYPLDLACIPIGGHFTMGVREAAKAVELLKPKAVIPMHYGTFPPVAADPQAFATMVGAKSKVIVLGPGQSHAV